MRNFTLTALLLSASLNTLAGNNAATTKENTPDLSDPKDTTIHHSYELSEVVVKDFRVNRHDLVPVASTELTAHDLDNGEVTSLKELSAVIPNFFMPDFGPRTTAPIYIRGVGMKSDGTSAAFYVDGVPYYEPLTFDIDMGDIASVEMLRGPQGTLFGRNAIGGIINIHTQTPFDYQGTRFNIGYGNYNDFRVRGSNYSRLSDRWALNVGAVYHHNDGFFRNAFDGKKTDQMEETEEHFGLYFKPADRWLLRLTSSFVYSDQGGYSYSPIDKETGVLAPIDYNRPSGFRRLVSTNGFMARYDGEHVSFNSQTSFQFLKTHQFVDQDYTSVDKTYLTSDRHQNMLSEELTLKSNDNRRYQWIVGAFGMYQHTNRTIVNDHPSTLSTSFSNYHEPTSTFALYHQSSYNIWRGLSLSAGIRFDYEHTHSRYTRQTVSGKTGKTTQNNDFDKGLDFTQVTPKFAIQYLTTTGNRYYATITRGYKPGGFNRSIADEDNQRYDPEYSWNYEIGTQLNFLDNKLSLNADLFYIDWRHMQLTYTIIGVGTLTTNAGHTDSKGAEVSLTVRPTDGLRFDVSYGYTYARFLSYHKSEKLDYTGNRLPMVPTNTLGVNANYTRYHLGWLDRLMVNVGVNALGKIFWAEDNKVTQNFYAVANAKVALSKGIFTWELWTKNFTNTHYLANVMTVSTGSYAQKGKPFTIGTSLTITL